MHSNSLIVISYLLFTLPVELPRVVKVVPHTIETTSDRTYGGEEGVAEPDGKNRILLPHALTATNFVVEAASHYSAYCKLEHTAEE